MQVKFYRKPGTEKNTLDDFMETERDENNRRRVFKLIRFLQTQGRELRPPISKHLGEDLHELRDIGMGYRVYYTFISGICAIVLICGNKKTQESDIKEAKFRKKTITVDE